MKKQHILIIIFYLLVFPIWVFPSSPQKSTNTPIYFFDTNIFQTFSEIARIETYYSVALPQLKFKKNDNGYLANFSAKLIVFSEKMDTVQVKVKSTGTIEKDENNINNSEKGLVDQIFYNLEPGDYFVKFSITDENSKKTSVIWDSLTVSPVPNKLSISDIQLASLISAESKHPNYTKANKTVIPNPSHRYQYHNSLLYLYYEIYNFEKSADSLKNSFETQYIITNAFNDTLIITNPSKSIKQAESLIKVQAIDISGLESGEHHLFIKIKDLANNASSIVSNHFTVSNPPLPETNIPLTDKDLKNYRDQIKYIATHEELKIFDSLPTNDKGTFLINFWKSKDYDLSTPENEFMMDCFARINYANKHFNSNTNGLNSDMGRIFIVYGQPDDIDRHHMEMNNKPYEIWSYYVGGQNHKFVFVDRNNENIYSLVHSTLPEEITNEGWFEREVEGQ